MKTLHGLGGAASAALLMTPLPACGGIDDDCSIPARSA